MPSNIMGILGNKVHRRLLIAAREKMDHDRHPVLGFPNSLWFIVMDDTGSQTVFFFKIFRVASNAVPWGVIFRGQGSDRSDEADRLKRGQEIFDIGWEDHWTMDCPSNRVVELERRSIIQEVGEDGGRLGGHPRAERLVVLRNTTESSRIHRWKHEELVVVVVVATWK